MAVASGTLCREAFIAGRRRTRRRTQKDAETANVLPIKEVVGPVWRSKASPESLEDLLFGSESICEICATSEICVGFWTTRQYLCRASGIVRVSKADADRAEALRALADFAD